MNGTAKRPALLGLLGALALTLSFLEGLLPPLPGTPPGFKLGLSNIVTLFAAGSLGLPAALFLAALKGGFAVLTRGLTAGLMSLSGGLLSALVLWVLLRWTRCSTLVVGVSGALAHNAGQLVCAWALTSSAVLFYAPALGVFAVLTGTLTGLIFRAAAPYLERFSAEKP